MVVQQGLDRNEGDVQSVRAMPVSILYTLNRCQVPTIQDDVVCTFFRRPVSLVNFAMYAETRRQIAWLVRTLGLDATGVGEYDDMDEEQLSGGGEWRGRLWQLDYPYFLTLERAELGGQVLVLRQVSERALAEMRVEEEASERFVF